MDLLDMSENNNGVFVRPLHKCMYIVCVAVCVQGFLPTLTCAVFCKAHKYVVLLPLGFYSFYL